MRTPRSRITVTTAVLAAAAAGLLTAPGAGAVTNTGASSSARVTAAKAVVRVAPARAHPRQLVKVTGFGFGARAMVTLRWDGATVVGKVTASAAGAWTATVPVPALAVPGRHTLVASGAGRSASAVVAVHTDWTQAGFNPRQTAANPYENVLNRRTVQDLTRQWTYDPDAGDVTYGGVAVAGGFVYTGVANFDTRAGSFLALNQQTGQLAWSAPGPLGAFIPPTINGATAFVQDANGALNAIDLTSHKVLWRANGHSGRSAPVVVGGIVYESGDGISAYDAETGAPVWYKLSAGPDLPLVSADPATGQVFTGTDEGVLYALDAATGAVQWSVDAATGDEPAVGGTTEADGIVYAATGNTVQARRESDGSLIWSSTPSATVRDYFTPALLDGSLFVTGDDGTITAFDTTTGTTRWATNAQAYPNGFSYPPPVLAGGVLYYAGSGRTEFLLDPATGTIINTLPMPQVGNNTAVVDGKVYTGTQTGIVAYDLGTP